MRRKNGLDLVAIDLAGGGAVAACVLLVAWLTLFRGEGASARIRELTSSVSSTRADVARAKGILEEQRALLAAQRGQLESRGRLPDHAPVEEYFQELARLARRNRLQMRGQSPLASRIYPGLLEQRFSVEVAGSLPNLARFFRAIEDCDYWADVGYFKIDSMKSAEPAEQAERIAQLTISLFSASSVQTQSPSGKDSPS